MFSPIPLLFASAVSLEMHGSRLLQQPMRVQRGLQETPRALLVIS